MKIIRKASFIFCGVLSACSLAHGQASPAASTGPGMPGPTFTGFQMPRTSGTLSWAATVSENVTTGLYGRSGTASYTNFSGDLAYLSNSKSNPFSAVYSGGYLLGTGGQPSALYQNLALSQVLDSRDWNFVVSDVVNYLPQTPVGGLSGIAGVGDLGLPPIQVGVGVGQGILTEFAPRVSNSTLGTLERRFTAKTSMLVSGGFLLQRFVGNATGLGVDSDQVTGSLGMQHRVDERNTVGGDYRYSHFIYKNTPYTFDSHSFGVDYMHRFTRQFEMNASVGPQWTSRSLTGANGYTMDVAANVSVDYLGENTASTLSYSRGTSSGSGVVLGAHSDSIMADARRRFTREWTGALDAGYARTSSLATLNSTPFSTQTFVGGVQASRQIGRSFYGFASYTAQYQTVDGTFPYLTAFSGLSHIFGVGLTYSPGSLHLGHR